MTEDVDLAHSQFILFNNLLHVQDYENYNSFSQGY
jgi:hypothetical protein